MHFGGGGKPPAVLKAPTLMPGAAAPAVNSQGLPQRIIQFFLGKDSHSGHYYQKVFLFMLLETQELWAFNSVILQRLKPG